MDWARILAYVTGTVDQELLARNEYLAAENRILKVQLNGRLKLSDAERGVLGEIGHRLGRKVLADVATIARPDTILGWYRKLVARKFDGSKARRGPGRPRIKREVATLAGLFGVLSKDRPKRSSESDFDSGQCLAGIVLEHGFLRLKYSDQFAEFFWPHITGDHQAVIRVA
jgi:hypothetical protein